MMIQHITNIIYIIFEVDVIYNLSTVVYQVLVSMDKGTFLCFVVLNVELILS